MSIEEGGDRLGWIGIGRMGEPMAERLVKAGNDVRIWNRTRAKADHLAKAGATLVDRPADLADADILFTMVATGRDLEEVLFGPNGVISVAGKAPAIVVDCSSIGGDESAALREKLAAHGAAFLAAPVSGNGKCVKAGKLSIVASGPRAVYDRVEPHLAVIAGNGTAYVGEGELSRFCKIAHNVFLSVMFSSLAEVTVLAEKAGVPRHAFLEFINNSVVGSIFTRYKTPALVNLDFAPTFTPKLLRKDIDLGLAAGRELDVPMPLTALTREALQAHMGSAALHADPEAYLARDFATLIETVARAAGMTLRSEDRAVPTGLEVEDEGASAQSKT